MPTDSTTTPSYRPDGTTFFVSRHRAAGKWAGWSHKAPVALRISEFAHSKVAKPVPLLDVSGRASSWSALPPVVRMRSMSWGGLRVRELKIFLFRESMNMMKLGR